jgi:hypothetical protein
VVALTSLHIALFESRGDYLCTFYYLQMTQMGADKPTKYLRPSASSADKAISKKQ